MRPRLTLPSLSLLLLFIAAAVVVLSLNAARLLSVRDLSAPARLSQSGAPVGAITPYTVVLREFTTDTSGQVTERGTWTNALRSDGSVVLRVEYAESQVAQRTVDLASGVTVEIDDVRELQSTTRKRPGAVTAARRDPRQECVKSTDGQQLWPEEAVIGSETINGYQTVRIVRRSSTNSPVTTTWLAPALGCARLKSSTRLTDGTNNEKRPVQITPGEPDDILFSAPAHYKEVPFSTFYQKDPVSPRGQELDRVYNASRPQL